MKRVFLYKLNNTVRFRWSKVH